MTRYVDRVLGAYRMAKYCQDEAASNDSGEYWTNLDDDKKLRLFLDWLMNDLESALSDEKERENNDYSL